MAQSLTTRLIQKFVQNITSFCCGVIYQYKVFKNDLKFDNICTIFFNKMSSQI